jgi:RNA polymerase sigma factor (sigma-70 family)
VNPYIKPEERTLLRNCLAGKRNAQRQLYERYVDAMYHTVKRMVVNTADTEDIVQETFVSVFQNLTSYKGDATLGAWIKRIAINNALNHIRKNGRIRFMQIEEQPDLAVAPQPWPAQGQDMRAVHQAIQQLPEGCRVVFNLYLLEGYQHQEIAQILGISASTSKSQYQRARKLLQQQLKKKVAISG